MDIETKMDLAVGRFIREMTALEVALQLVAGAVWRDEEWVERSLGSTADHVKNIRAKQEEFRRLIAKSWRSKYPRPSGSGSFGGLSYMADGPC